MLTKTEERYLKAIYKINELWPSLVSTNALAHKVRTSAASVTDMIKKLAAKELVFYEPYKGVRLSAQGVAIATQLVRKHRLWETFLVQKLDFEWSEVHEIAQHLEHIPSEKLVQQLDRFLDYPKFDPHGDPIPNAEGKFTLREQLLLSRLEVGQSGTLVRVKSQQNDFLRHLDKLQISMGCTIHILERENYDQSMLIQIDNHHTVMLSKQISIMLFVRPA